MNISACRSSRSIYSKVPPLGVPPPSLASQDTATTGRGPRFQTQAKATSVLPTEQMVKYSQKENIRQYAYWAKKLDWQPCILPCANNPSENKGNLANKAHPTHRISPQPSYT